jgi:hypothetical protein
LILSASATGGFLGRGVIECRWNLAISVVARQLLMGATRKVKLVRRKKPADR